MSLCKTIGDFFYRLDGDNNEVEPNWDALPEPASGDLSAIQSVGLNSTVDQYRSFTEAGRQVAAALDFQINTYSGEVFDTNGKKVAVGLEMLSFAMVDLGWITNSQATNSPFIDWGKVGRNDSDAASEELRKKIDSYGDTYWQHLTSQHII